MGEEELRGEDMREREREREREERREAKGRKVNRGEKRQLLLLPLADLSGFQHVHHTHTLAHVRASTHTRRLCIYKNQLED